jgi:cytochrome c556
MKNIKFISGLLLVLTGFAMSACDQAPPSSASGKELFKPTATVQEVMNSIIDPNMDYVWNSVATISTKLGVEEKRPKTDEDWSLVRQHALVVLEASNLLLIEGRPVAAAGASTSLHKVELGPEEIQKTINANREGYIAYVHALHAAVSQTIAAIDAKNVELLIQHGGDVDRVCEACHKQFWYPNDKRPTTVPAIKN